MDSQDPGEVIVEIDGLAMGGDAIGRQRDPPERRSATDGRATFVPLAAPGDRLRARIERDRGRVAWGELVALDISERMVALTRARGIDVMVGDVQALPFDDASFDCVVAGWVFYHVANRDRAFSECARVLRPGGCLAAATLADENLADLWEHVGLSSDRTLTFSTANGAEQLARHFEHVEVQQAEGVVVFPSPEAMRQFIAADITRGHAAANVPDFRVPFRARSHHTVFVATKAA